MSDKRSTYIRGELPGRLFADVVDVLRYGLPDETPEAQAHRVLEALGLDLCDMSDPVAEGDEDIAVKASCWDDAQGIMASKGAMEQDDEEPAVALASLRRLVGVLRSALGDDDWMTARTWPEHVSEVVVAIGRLELTWESMCQTLDLDLDAEGRSPFQASLEQHHAIREALKDLRDRKGE